ncbi:glutaredoxin family protein [Candidatus Microgenomates bacterium]|nr:glutaredoxin family protein [Candidatus Microgenomates bacterium]
MAKSIGLMKNPQPVLDPRLKDIKLIELWKNDCEHCETTEPILNELEKEGYEIERFNIETPEGEKIWRSYTKEIDENNKKMGYELGYIYTPTIINPKTGQLKAYKDRAPKKEEIIALANSLL